MRIPGSEWLSQLSTEHLTIRFPWMETVAQHLRFDDPKHISIIIPKSFGSLEEWKAAYQTATFGQDLFIDCFEPTDVKEWAVRLGLSETYTHVPGTQEWITSLISQSARPQPMRMGVLIESNEAWSQMEMWLKAQEVTGRKLISFVSLSHLESPLDLLALRLGSPQAFGNTLVFSDPKLDDSAWPSMYFGAISIWESGGIPSFCEELWNILDGITTPWMNKEFDKAVDERLNKYANYLWDKCWKSENLDALKLRFRKVVLSTENLCNADLELWHNGLLTWNGSNFDLTPIACRALINKVNLSSDDRYALKRRRLSNPILASWLSAWCGWVEEGLRLAVLERGTEDFQNYLTQAPARGIFQNRGEELSFYRAEKEQRDGVVAIADLTDLIKFLTLREGFANDQDLLNSFRVSRNNVVHDRKISAKSIQDVGAVVCLLRARGHL